MKYDPLWECLHPVMPGVQKFFAFPNGYGASVVRFKMMFSDKYGSHTSDETEWEVAVCTWEHPCTALNRNFLLTYDTPIASSVVGHVKDGKELEDLLEKIGEIPSRLKITQGS